MLGEFSERLRKLFAKIRGATYIDEKKLNEIVDDFVNALIEADVNVEVAFQIGERVKSKVLETKLPPGMPLNNVVLRVLYEELLSLLGDRSYSLSIKPGKTNIILFVGLQGSGKTTTVAKLAHFLKKRGYRVGIICADTYRLGAYEQLKQLAESINVPFYGNPNEKNPIKIVKEGLKRFKKMDVVLVDTAGRHKEEKGLLEEMKKLYKALHPDEVILVIDGMIGQRAYEQAKAFAETVPVGSIIITKLDGSAKGGGALAAAVATGAPVKFIGVGEKIEDLEQYVPQKFIARLLGIPDPEFLERLVKELPRDVLTGKFTLKDLMDYYESMLKKGGLIGKLKSMIGLSRISDREIRRGMGRQLAILKGMTKEELLNPELLKDRRRIERIAFGAGVTPTEVKMLLNQYEKMRKLVRAIMRSRRLSKERAIAQLIQGEFSPEELKRLLKEAS